MNESVDELNNDFITNKTSGKYTHFANKEFLLRPEYYIRRMD